MENLAELKVWAAKLDAEITDKDANEYFLRLPKLWLRELETYNAPVMLVVIAQALRNAQDAVDKFGGPTLRIVRVK